MKLNKRGFSVLELLGSVIVVAVIVALGWFAWQRHTESTTATKPTTDSVPEQVAPITSAGDLDKADKTLEQTDVGSSDSSQIDQQLSF
jgi:predicted negative regulator of RcsB-dependent stress response